MLLPAKCAHWQKEQEEKDWLASGVLLGLWCGCEVGALRLWIFFIALSPSCSFPACLRFQQALGLTFPWCSR